jgi:hypothetical protein
LFYVVEIISSDIPSNHYSVELRLVDQHEICSLNFLTFLENFALDQIIFPKERKNLFVADL